MKRKNLVRRASVNYFSMEKIIPDKKKHNKTLNM